MSRECSKNEENVIRPLALQVPLSPAGFRIRDRPAVWGLLGGLYSGTGRVHKALDTSGACWTLSITEAQPSVSTPVFSHFLFAATGEPALTPPPSLQMSKLRLK